MPTGNMKLVYCLLDENLKLSWPGKTDQHCCPPLVWHGNLCFTLPGGKVTISGGINFQLDTEPNSDPPVSTLTCTSTGGPATTVSWTRGNDTLNDVYNTSQVTDTVIATYVHSLRVTGRQEGSYSCSVSNNRTSPAAISTLQVAGKEPGISHDLSAWLCQASKCLLHSHLRNWDWVKVI